MRRSEAALAVVGQLVEGQLRWLARWNEGWGAYNLVGGHRYPGEAPRACLVREVHEELGLVDGVDCQVALESLACLQYTAWSERSKEHTAYVMDLFLVTLDNSALVALEAQPAVRWLTADEVRTGRTGDGRPVSQTMADLFRREGIILEDQP